MKYLKLIQQLSPRQWAWLWSAYWRMLVVQTRIKLRQQKWLRRKIELASTPPKTNALATSVAAPYIAQLHEAVRLAARLQFGSAACLPRSIVLADMLRSQGYSAQLRIGVNKQGSVLRSHAWVELNGEMIGEPDSVTQEFSALFNNHH